MSSENHSLSALVEVLYWLLTLFIFSPLINNGLWLSIEPRRGRTFIQNKDFIVFPLIDFILLSSRDAIVISIVHSHHIATLLLDKFSNNILAAFNLGNSFNKSEFTYSSNCSKNSNILCITIWKLLISYWKRGAKLHILRINYYN